MAKYNYKIPIAAALEMASNQIPYPCLAGIYLVSYLFRLWLFIERSISFSILFPFWAHPDNAMLGGHGARPLVRPPLGTNTCRIYRIVNNIAEITLETLEILPHGTKILQDLLKGGKVLRVSHPQTYQSVRLSSHLNPCQLTEEETVYPKSKM